MANSKVKKTFAPEAHAGLCSYLSGTVLHNSPNIGKAEALGGLLETWYIQIASNGLLELALFRSQSHDKHIAYWNSDYVKSTGYHIPKPDVWFEANIQNMFE